MKKLVGDSYSLRPKLKMQDKASFDHILENYTGGHGKYQIIITMLMTLLRLTNLHINFYQFTAYAPPHRCVVPSCEPSNRNEVQIKTFKQQVTCNRKEMQRLREFVLSETQFCSAESNNLCS